MYGRGIFLAVLKGVVLKRRIKKVAPTKANQTNQTASQPTSEEVGNSDKSTHTPQPTHRPNPFGSVLWRLAGGRDNP
jgi:hypothetical protein